MKLLSIKLKNINSLVGENIIDFHTGPLAQSGLFAITGPTGAGKSTILDALCLALYNRIPRFPHAITKEVIKNNGLILSRNQNDCYVNVEFQIKDKVYLASWSIAYNRNNNLNERVHTISEAGKIVEEKLSNVTDKIQQIIGLTYDQFIQTILLAQGQFAKLIHSKPDERNKILETITGTQYFRTIGIQIFKKYTELSNEVKGKQSEIGKITLLSDDELLKLNEELSVIIQSCETIQNEISNTKSRLEHKIRIENLKTEFNELVGKLEEKNLELVEFEPQALKIELFDQAAPFSQLINEVNQSEKVIAEKNKKLVELNDQFKLTSEEIETIFIQFHQNFGHQISRDSYDEEIRILSQKFEELSQKFRDQKSELDRQSPEIDKLVNELNQKEFSFKRSEKTLEDAFAALENIETELKTIGIAVNSGIFERQSILMNRKSDFNAKLQILIEKLKNEEQLAKRTSEFNQIESDLVNFQKQLSDIQIEILKADSELIASKNRFDKLDITAQLKVYRLQLADNEECPLCGSLHHPALDHQTENDEYQNLASEIERLQNNLKVFKNSENELEKKISKLDFDRINIQNLISEFKNKIQIQSKELQDFQLKENIEIQMDALKDSIEKFDIQIKQLNKAYQNIEIKTILIGLIEKQKNYNTTRSKCLELKQEIEKFSRFNFEAGKKLQEVSLALTKLTTQEKSFSEQLKELNFSITEEQSKAKQLKGDLNQKLINSPFKNVNEVIEILSIASELSNLRQKQSDLKSDIAKISGAKEQKENDLKSAISNDVELSKQDLEKLLSELNDSLKELQQQKTKIEIALAENEKNRKDWETYQNELIEISQKADLWKIINDKLGDGSGKKFSQFVQEITFKRLLYMSNQRLKHLSDRYKLAIDNEQNMMIIDQYMANSIRSVNTLSGGETFKISLAMALGLSDLSAGDVRIDTLFIDEGFGSLDPDAMHDAINLLEQLQNESGKMIGIISHITELKQRISTQIKLIPVGLGQSKISIEV